METAMISLPRVTSGAIDGLHPKVFGRCGLLIGMCFAISMAL
jgi:hypothetical protein